MFLGVLFGCYVDVELWVLMCLLRLVVVIVGGTFSWHALS